MFLKFTTVEVNRDGCETAPSLHLQNQIFVFVQYLDEDLKVAGKYKGNDYSQYSPWSCDTIGSYIGTKDAKPKDVVAARSVEMAVCRDKGKTEEEWIFLWVGKGFRFAFQMLAVLLFKLRSALQSQKHLQVCEVLCFQTYEHSGLCVAGTKFCM